jgi:cytochrome c oxidase assembly factor CtaG
MTRSMLPAVASVAAVLGAGMVVLSLLELAPLSAHMAVHILLMNVVAPCSQSSVAGIFQR